MNKQQLRQLEANREQEDKFKGTGVVRCWANTKGVLKPYIIGKGGDYKNSQEFIADRMIFLHDLDSLAHELHMKNEFVFVDKLYQTIVKKKDGMKVFDDWVMKYYDGEKL